MYRPRALLLAVFPCFAAIMIASCHGTPTLAEACTDRAIEVCALLLDCLPSQLAQAFGDAATCERRVALGCTSNAAIPAVGYEAEDVRACVRELQRGGCDGFAWPSAHGPSCARLERGTGTFADTCSDGLQCSSGACALSLGHSPGCGRCATLSYPGDTCTHASDNDDLFCEVGSFCDRDTALCTAGRQEGEPCDGHVAFACADGLRCHQGKCRQVRVDGDACSSGTADLCDPHRELTCDTQKGRCVRSLPPIRKVGESCAESGGVTPVCAPRAFCKASSPDADPTCAPLREDGQSCDVSSGENPCLYPSRCIDGQCGLPDPAPCGEK